MAGSRGLKVCRKHFAVFPSFSSGEDVYTAPNVYSTVSGVPPREVPSRAIGLGEVALRSRAR